jgi:hypothetical protein
MSKCSRLVREAGYKRFVGFLSNYKRDEGAYVDQGQPKMSIERLQMSPLKKA